MKTYRQIFEDVVMIDKLDLPDKNEVKRVIFQAHKDMAKVTKYIELKNTYDNMFSALNKLFSHINLKIHYVSFLLYHDVSYKSYDYDGIAKAQYSTTGKYVRIFLTNDFLQSRYSSDDKAFDLFWDHLVRSLEHEILHREQQWASGDSNKFKGTSYKGPGDEIRYLSDPREIMAWAHGGAVKLKYHLGIDKALKLIKNHKALKTYCKMYNIGNITTYFSWFKNNEKPIRKFFKYLYLYLLEMKNGKV